MLKPRTLAWGARGCAACYRTVKPGRETGFTLIELMVVIVIIGILVAIALPNFIGAQDRSRIASLKSNAHTLQVALESYAVDWGGAYPSAITEIEGHSGYKRFRNPFTGLEGSANASGAGAWRTNDDGDGDDVSNRLLEYPDDDDLSTGLVIFVGLNPSGLATTRFLGNGSNGPGPTVAYMIYACDGSGKPVRRFLLSNGQPTAAGARLLTGS